MVVLDKRLEAPETPPADWGITPRRHQLKDFTFSIKTAFFALLFIPVLLIPGTQDLIIGFGEEQPPTLFGLNAVLGIATVVVVFFSALFGLGIPHREAVDASIQQSLRWQRDVLAPYLENKFGVEFYGNDVNFFGFGYQVAGYEGRTIKVKLRGVNSRYNYKYGQDDSFRSFVVDPEAISLEEVVMPEKVSYRTIPAL